MTRLWRTGLILCLILSSASLTAAAEWTRAYINSLPDSAFAVVETTPNGKKIRRLPHHDQTGALDIAHLKSARARLGQVHWIDPGNKEKARLHLEKHWREYRTRAAAGPGLSTPLDLNRATSEDLMRLPRIGRKTARAIINYREVNGGFKSVNELQLIRGIGPKTFEGIADLVTVK